MASQMESSGLHPQGVHQVDPPADLLNASRTSAEPVVEFEAEALPHMNDLFRAAVRLLQDQSKASDAVQETYLIAWKSFDRYQCGSALTWGTNDSGRFRICPRTSPKG